MLNLVRGLTWSCNMDRIETINNAIMYNQSYCLKRVEYISNSSSILPPQQRMSETVLETRSCGHFSYMVIPDSDTSTDLDCYFWVDETKGSTKKI